MRLALSEADAAFRDELRVFFTTQIPAEILERARNDELRYPEDMVTTQQILNAAGLAVPNWPVEWGGKDWTRLQHQIWADEMRLAGVPEPQPIRLPGRFFVGSFGVAAIRFPQLHHSAQRRMLPAS